MIIGNVIIVEVGIIQILMCVLIVECKDTKTYGRLYCEKCGERVFELNDAISCGEDSECVIVYCCSDDKDILEKWDLGRGCDHMTYIALTKEERDLKFGYKDL